MMSKRFRYNLVGLMLLVLSVQAAPATANFNVCNIGKRWVFLAVAYRDESGWKSKGWSAIKGLTCETVISGPLISRYVYVHAIERKCVKFPNTFETTGVYEGDTRICARTVGTDFELHEIENCDGNLHQKVGFLEIDTLDEESWTLRLGSNTSPEQSSNKAEEPTDHLLSALVDGIANCVP